MRHNRKIQKELLSAPAVFIPAMATIILMIFLVQCSTTSISRKSSPDGKLETILVSQKDKPVYRYELIYDKKDRLNRIERYSGNEKDYNAIHRFYYDRYDRLKLHWFKAEHLIEGKTVTDEHVESFIFNRAGKLIRTEISYKKPYSIKKSHTPLIKTNFEYRQNLLEEITLDGGRYTFTKRAVLKYDGSKIDKIEYVKKMYMRKQRKEIMTHHMTFYMDDREPYKFLDKMSNETINDDDVAQERFRDEGIWMSLMKPDYAKNPDIFIEVLLDRYK